MFVNKYLYLNGERFEVLSFEFSCYRSTGYEGEPTSEIKGITLRLRIRSNYDNTLYKAMIQQYSLLQGKLVFERENEGSKEIIFMDAVISHFEESFSATGEYPMNIYIEIRPRNMRYDGIDFRDHWPRAGEPDRLEEYCKHEQAKPQEVVKEKKECECEARVRAFMRMIRECEGTKEQKGYTTLFGRNNQFSDMSKHPEKVITEGGHSSSAAGAYQIMRYTWWELKGEELDIKHNKTGIYLPKKDYLKKYNITDFSAESQDKMCLIIFKHKRREEFLKLLIEGKTQEAIEKHGSYEWASLPPGRYGQPVKTMEQALAFYDKYLKEELTGQTTLHLKKGFLKEFITNCCSDAK